MKINEAQHAHLAMKEAEDHANKLRRHAQYQRNLSNNYEMQIAQLASKETERWHSEQTVNNYDDKGYGGLTSIDFCDQMSKASEVTFGNSIKTSAMGYGGIHDVSNPSVDDSSALMGGYSQSVASELLSDNPSVNDVSALMGGYSQSVASELLSDIQHTANVPMTENVVAVKEESMSKDDETSVVMTKSIGDGLIPSPAKNETGSFSGDSTHMNGNTGTNTDPYSMIGAMSLNADNNVGISNLNNNFGMMNLGNAYQQQTIEGTGFGIMSQSTDGGIPTPTASKDEFDQAHW